MCADLAPALEQEDRLDPEAARAARRAVVALRTWVVKVGSALLTDDGMGLQRDGIERWAGELAGMMRAGRRPVLVSSGAIAAGMSRLGLRERPRSLGELQAAAAVGQMGLIEAWERAFGRHGLHTALILLTHEDLADRRRYLNARSTLRALLERGVVPVINENDTVATEEIRFGDNDTLGALVTNLLEAEGLILLTDQQGLRARDPERDPAAPLIASARAADTDLDAMAGVGTGRLGRGGMLTKLRAARLAARSGAVTLIADGREPAVLTRLVGGEPVGTLLVPDEERLAARKRWIAGHLQTRGTLVLDDGAVQVLRDEGRSLLPVGVTEVRGEFSRGEVGSCRDRKGREVARGLVNYTGEEARRIAGRSSREIEASLGYVGEAELVHRDNLVLL